MPTAFKQVANNAQSTLAEDLTNVETDIDVASGHGARFPAPGNGFYATIWDADTYPDPFGDPSMEVVLVTARSGDTLTVTRGQRGTTGVAHSTGHAIRLLLDSTHVSDLQTAVNTVENYARRVALICEEQASGNGPTEAPGTGWTKRTLNTELWDPDGLVSLSSSEFTLAAGTYEVEWWCPASGSTGGGAHVARLYNVTDAASLGQGVSFKHGSTTDCTVTHGVAVFTIAGSKAFRIDHISPSGAPAAGGVAAGTGGAERYTMVKITKIG